MGCRLEIYTNADSAAHMITIARHWGVEAKLIGRVEQNTAKELEIRHEGEILQFKA
jgi:hydrogenase maturation factor HypE